MLSVFGAMKQQMMESVNGFDVTTGQQFNVIFFYDDQYQALFKEERMLPVLTTKNLQWISSGTRFLQVALSRSRPSMRRLRKSRMFFMFDRWAFQHERLSFSQLSNAFKQGNRDGKMKINCIFLQTADDPTLSSSG